MTGLAERIKQKINFKDYFRKEFPEKYREGKNSFSPFEDDGKNPDFTLYDDHGIDQHSRESYDVIKLRQIKYNEDFKTALKALADHCGIETDKKDQATSGGKLIAVYDYFDRDGHLYVQHLRYENKMFPWQRPDPHKPGVFIKKDVFRDYARIPYRLPELLQTSKDRVVIICEGEKDSDNVARLGFTSTTFGGKNDHTSAIKNETNIEFFRDRIVWLVADKDWKKRDRKDPRAGGYKAFREVASVLVGVAKEIRLFLLPGGRKVKDPSDLIELHGTKKAKGIIEAQARRAPVFKKRTKLSGTAKVQDKSTPVVAERSEKPNKFQMLDECIENMDLALFFDQAQTPWASIKIGDHYENVPTTSSVFRRMLRKEFYKHFNDGLSGQTIDNLMDARLGIIQHTQPPRPLYIRTCWNDTRDKILVDSGRSDWAIFEIRPDGWDKVYLKENPFKRAPKTASFLCTPETPRARWDNLFEFVRVKNDHQKTIAKIWLSLALFPDTPRPGLVMVGPHGSGKSTAGQNLKRIVDPATNTKPKRLRSDADDMIAALASYAVSVLDNVTAMNSEMSDLLCLTITGVDDEKRRLFTDGDVFNTEIMVTWILTSLNNPGKMGDFLSRVFLLELDLLPKEERIEDEQLKRLADRYLAGIQALVFDCISEALKNHDSISENVKPRLGQAYIYSLAMADSLGVDKQTIREVWESNRVEQDAEVSASEILTELIPEFIKHSDSVKHGRWEGTSKVLFEELYDYFEIDKKPWKHSFPKNEVHLSRRLNNIRENLSNEGIWTDLHSKKKIFEDKQFIAASSSQGNPGTVVPTEQSRESIRNCKQCKCYNRYKNYCAYLDGPPDPDDCDCDLALCEPTSNVVSFPESINLPR